MRPADIRQQLDVYLSALKSDGGKSLLVDVCPDHSAHDAGFVVNDTKLSNKADRTKPTLLYLPGLQADDLPFFRVRQLLLPHFRLVSVAYRRVEPHTSEQYTADVLEAMGRLDLPPVHILAESTGSLPGVTLAIEQPKRVRSLMLAGGFVQSLDWVRLQLGKLGIRLTPTFVLQQAITRLAPTFCFRYEPEPRMPPRLIEAFSKMRTSGHLQEACARINMIGKWDARDRLAEIKVPVLYMYGRSDRTVPWRREIRTLRDALDTVEVAEIKPAGHPILLERPNACAEQILKFCKSIK
jgi:pimeloyl-ACP methyl ester carboxylesterase